MHRAYILDLDGVVYRGQQILPGARAFVEEADAAGRPVLFLSNNSFATPDEVAAKLARLGIPYPEPRVLTAGQAAAAAIAERFPGGRVFVLGVEAVERMVAAEGLACVSLAEAPESAQAVLVGLDRRLTYERLRFALRAVLAGAAFVAINRDPRLPIEDGFEPGTGAIVAALAYASGMTPDVIGKPEPGIVHQALRRLGSQAGETLMIGDGLDLDIVAGHRAGVETALVLTGLNSRAEADAAEGERRPDHVYDDLTALLEAERAAS